MISAILYDEDIDELSMIEKCFKDAVAHYTDDYSRLCACSDVGQLYIAVGKSELNDMSMVEFTAARGQQAVRCVRGRFPESLLLLIVDNGLSPASYIRPGIMASSVIIRPTTSEEIYDTVGELIEAYASSLHGDDKPCYIIDTRDGITRIPYEKIYYIEASAKRVYIRLRKEEYICGETLESLEGKLPENFVRCHRGYIVNMDKVRRYSAADSLLYLDHDINVPVSRSSRARIRGAIR